MTIEKKTARRILMIIAIVILLASAIFGGIYYYRHNFFIIANKENLTAEETKILVKMIGKIIDLPPDEQPTVATVIDRDKLKTQVFFAKAEKGDRVLIYTKAQKAILFRPSEKKVMEVMNLQTAILTPSPSLVPEKEVGITIYDGSGKEEAAGLLAKSLEEKVKGISIDLIQKTNGLYRKSIMMDLKGNNLLIVKEISTKAGIEIGQMPADEALPDSDLAIILGQDWKP